MDKAYREDRKQKTVKEEKIQKIRKYRTIILKYVSNKY
jgi:hypothetical protein